MKLYYAPGACSLASHIALVENGQDFDAVKVDLGKHRTEDGRDFYDISARGYVPAIDVDGLGVLTENPAVLTYLADRSGSAPSGDERYRMLEWLGFIGTEIHGAFGPLFGNGDDASKAKAKDMVTEKFRLTEKLMKGGEWLVGDEPGVADNYLFVTLLWAGKFDIDLPQSLKDYRARNMERAAVKTAMGAEGLN